MLEFSSRPDEADVQALGALGFEVDRHRNGTPRGFLNTIVVNANSNALNLLRASQQNPGKIPNILQKIQKIRWDGSPFRAPPPLEHTAKEIQAQDAWAASLDTGVKLRGAGVTVCGVDTGIDIFHPLFFREDGGYWNWKDNDGNGVLTPGVDTVEGLGAGEAVLQTLNSAIMEYYGNEPLFGSDDPAYQPGSDWIYADVNGSGAREFGPANGFGEADPGYGEPLFVADDVNHNGKVDVGEKLVRLMSSKVRAVRWGKKIYRRGINLIDMPDNPEAAHGTSSASVMVGGHVGLSRFVGIAPDAEIVVGVLEESGKEFALTNFCVDEGARVVLHEYAPWLGYHLDGSSPLEKYIDQTAAEGVSHINPAGNLSGSQKLYKRTIPAGVQTDVPVIVPQNSPWGTFYFMGISLLWRDIQSNVGLVLEDPLGNSMPVLGANPYDYVLADWVVGGQKFFAVREDSDRGTARVDIYLYDDSGNALPVLPGTWTLHVTEPNPTGNPGLELIAFTMDDVSGWGQGIYFPEYASEEHLIGYPGTSDHGLGVSAYTGNGYWGEEPGQRAPYSGRGHRIDGMPILWIAAPDDPIAAGYREGVPALYTIFGGTSGASPHVAGAAALVIQADPARTGVDVRDVLAKGALADAATQAVPNDDFGYGKLRIHRSLFGEEPPLGGPPSIMVNDSDVVAGVETAVPVQAAGNQSDAIVIDVDWNYDGVYDEVLKDAVLRHIFEEVGEAVVKVRATDTHGREGTALARLRVLMPEVPPKEDRVEYEAVGGGGCGIGGPGLGGVWAFLLGGFLGLGLRKAYFPRCQAPRTKAMSGRRMKFFKAVPAGWTRRK